MSIEVVTERNLDGGGFLLSKKKKKKKKERYNACFHNTRPWKLCGSANVIKDQPMLRGEQPSHPILMQPNLQLGL